jgi:HKD family nuclease
MNITLVQNSELPNSSHGKNHLQILSELILDSEVCILCSGWLKNEGIEVLTPVIKQALENKTKITIISNQAHTHKRASKRIAGWKNVTHYMAKNVHRVVHAKIYYFEAKGAYTAVVGSANITKGGLMKSDELSMVTNGVTGDNNHKQIKGYLNALQKSLQA